MKRAYHQRSFPLPVQYKSDHYWPGKEWRRKSKLVHPLAGRAVVALVGVMMDLKVCTEITDSRAVRDPT